MQKNICCLFTCFNRKDKTISTIKTLMNQYNNINFVIVDDKSTDGTYESIKDIDNITIIRTKGNCYYTKSMRIGMNYIRKNNIIFDYLLLINDDVLFYDDIINKLLRFNNNNNCVIIGSTIDDDNKLSYGGILYNKNCTYNFERVGADYKYDVDTFNCNCVLIPYKVFINNEIIDKHYSHGFGDFDYGLQLKKNNVKLLMFDKYVGVCNRNDIRGTYLDNSLSLIKRLRLKHHPKGLPFKEYFYFCKKNFGLKRAVIDNYIILKNAIKMR